MRRTTEILLIIIVLLTGIVMFYLKTINKEPKGLVPKFETGWERKDEFVDFNRKLGLPIIWPKGLLIKGNFK